jgi:hypothetical protein
VENRVFIQNPVMFPVLRDALPDWSLAIVYAKLDEESLSDAGLTSPVFIDGDALVFPSTAWNGIG